MAYGRYERVDTANHTLKHTLCVFQHYATAQTVVSNAMALHYRHTTSLGEWLLLLFSVPCGSLLKPFKANSAVCDIGGMAASHTLCADNARVVVLLHAAGVSSTSMHFVEQGTVRTEQMLHSNCIYMQQGVFWIDAAVYAHAPRKREIETLLMLSARSSGIVRTERAAVRAPAATRVPKFL